MKILIIDDSDSKINRIVSSVNELVSTSELFLEKCYWGAKKSINENMDVLDFIICDMQFPETYNGHIGRESGIKVLDYIAKLKTLKNFNVPVIIASSDDNVHKLLEAKGHGDIKSIKASSMYDLTSQLEPLFKEFGLIKTEPKGYSSETGYKHSIY